MHSLYSIEYLNQLRIPFNIIKLERKLKSAKDVVELYNCPLSHVIKTLVFIDVECVLVCIPGNKVVGIKKLTNILNLNQLNLATPDEAYQLTGYRIGGICPFIRETHRSIKYVMDKSCLYPEKVNIGSGLAEIGLEIETKYLEEVWPGAIEDITN